MLGAFLFIPFLIHAQFIFDDNCNNAYKAILSMRFKDASDCLDLEKKLQPDNRITAYLENYIDFMTLFIDEDRAKFEKLRGNEAVRVKFLEKADKSSPYYKFCLALVKLQWGFIHLKFGEYITAVNEIRKASQLLEANKTDYPNFVLNYSGLGIIHTITGLIPEQYKWLANLMGLEGSVEQGVNDLESIISYQGNDEVVRMFKPEILFYLAFIQVNLKKDKTEALNILRQSDFTMDKNENDRNPLSVYYRSSILMKTGFNDEAIKILSGFSNPPDRHPILFLDYLTGVSELNCLDPKADIHFLEFLNKFHGMNYLKAACQKLAWSALIHGDMKRYEVYIGMVLKVGYTYVDEDKQALKEAQKKEIPNVTLLRARLLFDGGYYSRALHELLDRSLSTTLFSKKDLLEYIYRLGRIYHEMGNIAKAIQNYETAISLGAELPYYFAANAALQLGIIYEGAGKYAEAGKYYRLSLSMPVEEYKNSLSQKAKAGLARIKKGKP